jgi:hypothetical protein
MIAEQKPAILAPSDKKRPRFAYFSYLLISGTFSVPEFDTKASTDYGMRGSRKNRQLAVFWAY